MRNTVLFIATLSLFFVACDAARDLAEAPQLTATGTATPRSIPTATSESTATREPTQTREPTSTLGPSKTASRTLTTTPRSTKTATASPTVTETPRPEPVVRVSSSSANVRSGPGTSYPVIGVLEEGDSVLVIATNMDGSWFNVLLPEGSAGWLSASVSEPVDQAAMSHLIVALTIPAPPPTSVPYTATIPSSSIAAPPPTPGKTPKARTATPTMDHCATPPAE